MLRFLSRHSWPLRAAACAALALVFLLGALGGGERILGCLGLQAQAAHACCGGKEKPAGPACAQSCACCEAHPANGLPGPLGGAATEVPPAPLAVLGTPSIDLVARTPEPRPLHSLGTSREGPPPRDKQHARLMVFLI